MPIALKLNASARGGLPILALEGVSDFGLDAFVTTRRGGVSAAPYDSLNLATHVGDNPDCVDENRRRVAAALGLESSQLVTTSQVHGAVVNNVDEWAGEGLVGDSLVTSRHDVALAVMVADCVPLLIVEANGPTFALVHCGWRGLVKGIIAATLARFAQPPTVHVVIGPHVSPARYEVGPEVAQHFLAVEGAVRGDVGGRDRLDLGVVAAHQLRHCGVPDAQITLCTDTTDDGGVFFSDRAQRPCGRFAVVARSSNASARVQRSNS